MKRIRALFRRERSQRLEERSLCSQRNGIDLGRGPAGAERLQNLIKVRRDADFIVQKILQPDEVHSLSHRHQREQFA